jgi:wyosine [tRNA(Phe)-imidazoG37] synthetase (radical SAM superfamily)
MNEKDERKSGPPEPLAPLPESERGRRDVVSGDRQSPQIAGSRQLLSVVNHDRDREGMTYIYAVVSRRAGGVSLGINLNPNNACNWHCVYCQVPGLKRGPAPAIDHELFRRELRAMLDSIVHGTYLAENAPPEARTLKDLAISGNGEPTACATFDRVIDEVGEVLDAFGLKGKLPLTLITNGSLIGRARVLRGLQHFGKWGGEVWYKLDAISDAQRREINDTPQSMEQVRRHLRLVSERAKLRLQRCVFARDGQGPSVSENQAYVDFVASLLAQGLPLAGVTIYGLARPSMQAQAERLSALPREVLEAIAQPIRALGCAVDVHL